MTATLNLGGLAGGGLILGYRCSARCRHCLYGCGPHRRDGRPSLEELDAVLDLLQRKAPVARYHIGGGEPFLDRELLAAAVNGFTRRGLTLDYVETNSSWVRSLEQASDVLSDLGRLGLRCVLVSLSPFHAEQVPLERARWLARAAQRTLTDGAFVWIPGFLPDLAPFPADQRLDLDALLAERGDEYARALADRYGLVPSGRAGRYLHAHGQRRPWEELLDEAPCASRLRDTSHFHVDGQGRYVPGLCPGIVLPLDELPGPLALERFPVVATLLGAGGLGELARQAVELGFEPDATYAAACDLCCHLRQHLHRNRPTADLGPHGFYDARSVPGFAGASACPGQEAGGPASRLRLVDDGVEP